MGWEKLTSTCVLGFGGSSPKNTRFPSAISMGKNAALATHEVASSQLIHHHRLSCRGSVSTGPDGNLTSRITYDYEGDRLARKSTYDPNGNLLRRNVYRRDQKGLVI